MINIYDTNIVLLPLTILNDQNNDKKIYCNRYLYFNNILVGH